MKSNTSINLNLQMPNYSVVVYAVQGDAMSREVTAALYDGQTPFEPPYGALGTVRYMKPDGTSGFYDTMEDGETAAVTWEGNVATIKLAEQMITVPGDVVAQVSFYTQDAERLSAFNFKIVVEKNPLSDEEFESTDYYSVLTADIASILEVVQNMPAPATVLPEMDGTAAIGVRGEFARADHVHPKDTLVLYFTSVSCSAISGNFASVSNASITSNHVLAECVFANPSAIKTDITWTTASGSLTLNGTCSSATTCNVVLVKKDN